MSRVLVTDGEQRSALAVVRSLGRAGHDVFVTSSRRRSLAGASRHCRGQIQVPDPLQDGAAFASAVAAAVGERSIDVLLPISEAALLCVLEQKDRFTEVSIPVPDLATIEAVCDKAAVTRVAAEIGIRVPGQHVAGSPEELGRLASSVLRPPLVLKPARSVVRTDNGRAKSAVVHAPDAAALDAALAALPREAYPVLVQERIEGPGIGVFLLIWDGALIASFAHRRIREKPPSGGVSVYRESIVADAGLIEASRRLLERFDWRGVAMVEYKIDERTGTPHLMEINGRFWGSLQLAVDAGVDFPTLLLASAAGERPEPTTNYRPGVRLRWWWGDVDHLLARMRRSARELALPPGSPGRIRAVLDFLAAFAHRSRNEILRLDDPRPALREALDWLRGR